MSVSELFKVILISIILIGGVTAQSPPETECTSSDTSACQKPLYTDDQNEYLYDQDASWVFSGESSPDSSGPSISVPHRVRY